VTDEDQNLAPAKPVAPRRKLNPNRQMAQPMNRDMPEEGLAQEHERAIETDPEATAEVRPTTKVSNAPYVAPRPPVQLAVEDAMPPKPAMAAPTRKARAKTDASKATQSKSEGATSTARAASTARTASTAEPAVATPGPAPIRQPEFDFPKTVRETLARVDQAWAAFRAAVLNFPGERLNEPLGEGGWTRKQMLAHIAAWHDLSADRVVALINNGHIPPFDGDGDSFNAAVARRAVGKTAGEVLKDVDATFNRLRRQMARLTDAQLAEDDWYAAFVIGGNTYGHYEEHWADLSTANFPAGSGSRR